MAMNTGKVVVGGLVAGLVFNIGDFVINTMLLAADNAAFMTRLGLVVWTYAAIRPRFGPGVSTAIIAGLIPFLGATLVLGGFTSMGVFTTSMFIKGTVGSLVNTVIGAVAGAWVYTEA